MSAFYVTRKSKRRAPVHGLPHVDFCNALEAVLRLHGGTLVEYCHQALLVDHLSCGRIIIWLGRPRGELVIRALGVVTESGERATVSAIWDVIWVAGGRRRRQTYLEEDVHRHKHRRHKQKSPGSSNLGAVHLAVTIRSSHHQMPRAKGARLPHE